MNSYRFPYEITLSDWEAVVDGDADGDGLNGRLLEIKGGSELGDLPDPSREAILGAVAHFGGSLVGAVEAEESRGSTQIQERAQLAAELFDVLLCGTASQVNALIDAIQSAGGQIDTEGDLIAVEEHARFRMKATYLTVMEESFTVAQLREWLRLSRQRVKQLRDEDRLFAIKAPYERSLLYPRWQFDVDGRPRHEMPGLIAAARAANLDALGFHLLMTGSRGDEPSGVQMLREGRPDVAFALVNSADR
jgi:hypothetical protein